MMTEHAALAQRFENEMKDLYHRRLKEMRYNAGYLRSLIAQYGGLDAARRIIAIEEPSEGLTKLALAEHLELSVQWLMLEPHYASLFIADELRTAWDQLNEWHYQGLATRPRP